MRVFIVHAHPEPSSFNAAMKDLAVETLSECGHEVRVSDLYAMGFNPVAGRHDFRECADPIVFHYQREQRHAVSTGGFADDVSAEQEKLAWCDLLIMQFPIWWFGLPAILKGWVDRVVAVGFAYDDGKRFERGLMRGRRGLLALTTGGTRERFSPDGPYGEIGDVLRPVQAGVLAYMGLDVHEPFVAYAAPRVDDAERAAYLAAYRQRLRTIHEEPTQPPEAIRNPTASHVTF